MTKPSCTGRRHPVRISTEIQGNLTDILRDFGISDGYFRQPSRTVRASPSRARCTAPTPRQRSSCDCPRRAHRPRPSSSAQPPPPATAPTFGCRPSWLLGTTPGPSRTPWPIRSSRLSWRTSSNPRDYCWASGLHSAKSAENIRADRQRTITVVSNRVLGSSVAAVPPGDVAGLLAAVSAAKAGSTVSLPRGTWKMGALDREIHLFYNIYGHYIKCNNVIRFIS